MPALQTLKSFDVNAATVALWTFKKSIPTGSPPKFNGRWIDTSLPLDAAIKGAVIAYRDTIEEVIPYDILAQNNEASVMEIETIVTHAGLMIEEMAAETQEKQ